MISVEQHRKYLVANSSRNATSRKDSECPESCQKILDYINKFAADLHQKHVDIPPIQKIKDWHLCKSKSLGKKIHDGIIEGSQKDFDSEADGVLLLSTYDSALLDRFRSKETKDQFAYFRTDMPIDSSETWQNLTVAGPFDGIFGNRSQAGRLMGLDCLQKLHQANRGDGANVNVVVIDKGLDEVALTKAGAHFGGGWTTDHEKRPPGGTTGPEAMHGSMLVRNIRHAAPNARFWDCPLIQDGDQATFLCNAHSAFRRIINDIARLRASPGWEQSSWVLVNAWAVYESRRQGLTPDEYNANRNHPFNQLLDEAADAGIDVVFCAGNCGEFWPDERCGARDRGRGRSIFGANGHPRVLTVGAVRTDAVWLGYSSQGPGQKGLALNQNDPAQVKLAEQKPDLCVPSHFAEDDDAQSINTGTSAACGLAAGVVAALRSCRDAFALPPDDLKAILRATGRQLPHLEPWDSRLGCGLLDVKQVLHKLRLADCDAQVSGKAPPSAALT